MSKVIELKSSVPLEHKGREGLTEGNPNDEWLHSNMSDSFIREVNRTYRTRDLNKSEVSLTIRKGVTGRTLNRAKLVKRAVQVRGKDGKIYTRMQWVDPNKDKPTEERTTSEEVESDKTPKVNVDVDFWTGEKDYVLEASKVKVYDTDTQKGFIDKHIDDLSKDEKKSMIHRLGITWKHNDHPSIDWKNAVMALKSYLYEHPEEVGAGHLPKDNSGKTTLSGTDKVNDFCNKLSREELYALMKEHNIYTDPDPRTVPEWASKSEGGDGTAPIRHMKNMMALKRYLGENPHLIDKTPKKTTEKETKTIPSTVGKDIDSILKAMSDEEKYDLMSKLGIADNDPRKDPRYDKITGDKTAPIRHMKNMMSLKKHLALHPEDLGNKVTDEVISKEKEKNEEKEKTQEKIDKVKDILSKLSRESKLGLLKKFENEPEIKNRERKENPSIDYMKSMMALKSFLEKNPDKLAEVEKTAEKEELLNFKISVKMLEKILRDIVGISSTQIDYAVVVDKGKEWKFGISSFAIIQLNEDDEPVLSVVDTGDDGTDWEEYEYPMTQIRDFVNKAKKDKAEAKKDAELVQRNEIPLHKKSIADIEKTLNRDFNKFTSEVGEVLKPVLAHYWDAASHSGSIKKISTKSYLTEDTMKNLFAKYNVSVDEDGFFDTSSDNWMRVACSDKITATKDRNANDYLFTNKNNGKVSAFALKESAKNWSASERYEARGELIGARMSAKYPDKPEQRELQLIKHLNNGTLFVPFDLISDMMASGLKFDLDVNGGGCHYRKVDNTISLSNRYVTNSDLLNDVNTFEYKPQGCHPIGESVAHEFAHAIDGFFSGRNTQFLQWNSENAKKYVDPQYRNCVRESYFEKVNKSNPDKEVVHIQFNGIDSYYHKDEWINTYESRMYGVTKSSFEQTNDGRLLDTVSTPTNPVHNTVAVEHWSENVSRFAKAVDLYRLHVERNPDSKETSMDEWAEKMYNSYKEKGYGDDYTQEKGEGYSYTNGEKGNMRGSYKNRDAFPEESTGYLFYKMKSHYPIIWKGIDNILNRPDFVDDTKTKKPTERANAGDFTRKSMLILRR